MYWDSGELEKTKNNLEIHGFKKKKKRRGLFMTIWEWKPSGDNIVFRFFRQSTLHGVKYIGRLEVHIFERLLWLVIVAALTAVSVKWILDLYAKFTANPVLVSFQPFEIQLDEIPFPAITICNINNIRKSKAREIEKKYKEAEPGSHEANITKEALNYLEGICDSTSTFANRFHYDREEIMSLSNKKILMTGRNLLSDEARKLVRPARQSCGEMITLCLWRNIVKNCTEFFRTIFTDMGYCCVFNMIPLQLLAKNLSAFRYHHEEPKRMEMWKKWNIDKNILETDKAHRRAGPPRHQRKGGIRAGLSVLLEPEVNDYLCPSFNSQGFQLTADSPIDYPLVREFGKGIRPNIEAFVDIRPELTMVDENVLELPVEKRNCYFNKEYKLAFYNYYTNKNCIQECIANLTYHKCRCAAYNMPRTPDQKICYAEAYHCVMATKRKVSIQGVKDLCKQCLPACTQVKYDLSTSYLPLSKSQIWTNAGIPANWSRKKVTILHVYFGSTSVYSRVRQLIFDTSDFLASSGGILGFFLGFSFVSLLEIGYHFFLRPVSLQIVSIYNDDEGDDDK